MQTKGGIWPALVGTIYLVGVSLAVAAPDRRAGGRLPERVRARQLVHPRHSTWPSSTWPACPASCTRCSASARSCCSPGSGQSILAASLTLAIMTLPVIIASTREALAAVPRSFREACWNVGATRWQTIRAHRAAQLDQRHPDRRDPAGVARRRRDGADPVHRRGVLQGRRPRAICSPTGSTTSAWRCRCTSTTLATQVNGAPEALPYATASCSLGAVLLVNATAIVLRACPAQPQEVVDGAGMSAASVIRGAGPPRPATARRR